LAHYFEHAAKYKEKIKDMSIKRLQKKNWLGRPNAGYDFNGRFLNGILKEIVLTAGDSSLRSERHTLSLIPLII